METHNVFSKTEQVSSSKHETEWDHQLPNRYLYRTSYEVIVKSSVIKKEVKVLGNQPSPLTNREADRNQSNQKKENYSDATKNDTPVKKEKSNMNSDISPLLSSPTESSTPKHETSVHDANFNESECKVVRDRVVIDSGDNQLPEYLKNYSDLNGKNETSLGKSGLFDKKYMNFYSKKHSNHSSRLDHSPQKLCNDSSLFSMENNPDKQRNDFAGGDCPQQEIENTFFLYDDHINKQKTGSLDEKTVYAGRNVEIDRSPKNLLKTNKETHSSSNNILHLESQHQKFINKKIHSCDSKPFICQETNEKYSHYTDFGDAYTDSSAFKLAKNEQEDTSTEENQESVFKSSRTPFENKEKENKNYHRRVKNTDGDFDLQNIITKHSFRDPELSEKSKFLSDLKNEFSAEEEELVPNVSPEHIPVSSDNAIDLFKQCRNFSFKDCDEKLASVSSNVSSDGNSYESMNFFDSSMNTTYGLMDKIEVPFACQNSDLHQDLKINYLPGEQVMERCNFSDSLDENESDEFDINSLQTHRSFIKTDAEDFRIAEECSEENSSLVTDKEHKDTTSNSNHSDEDSDNWKISVNELVEYFEKLNSKAELREKKGKSGSPLQLNLNYDDKNEKLLDLDKNSEKLFRTEITNKENSSINKDANVDKNILKAGENGYHGHYVDKSTDLLHHEEIKKLQKCDLVDKHDKNKNFTNIKCNDCYEYELKDPPSVIDDLKYNESFFSAYNQAPLSQGKLLNLKQAKHKTIDCRHKPNNDNPKINLLQNKLLSLKLAGNSSYREEETYYSKHGFSSEKSRDNSFGAYERINIDRFPNSDNMAEQSGESSLERNKSYDDSKIVLTSMTSCRIQTPGVNLETKREHQSCSMYTSLLKRKFCDQDSEYEGVQRIKLSKRESPSRDKDISCLKHKSSGMEIAKNLETKEISNRNCSDIYVASIFSEEPTDKTVKSDILNLELIKNPPETKISNKNQRTLFSRRRLMVLFCMSVMIIFAASDLSCLLKYIE